jgi:hypothetical protein
VTARVREGEASWDETIRCEFDAPLGGSGRLACRTIGEWNTIPTSQLPRLILPDDVRLISGKIWNTSPDEVSSSARVQTQRSVADLMSIVRKRMIASGWSEVSSADTRDISARRFTSGPAEARNSAIVVIANVGPDTRNMSVSATPMELGTDTFWAPTIPTTEPPPPPPTAPTTTTTSTIVPGR